MHPTWNFNLYLSKAKKKKKELKAMWSQMQIIAKKLQPNNPSILLWNLFISNKMSSSLSG